MIYSIKSNMVTTVIYRQDPTDKTSPWTSDDGLWKGKTWNDVHTALKSASLSAGVPENGFDDVPVYPWARLFSVFGHVTLVPPTAFNNVNPNVKPNVKPTPKPPVKPKTPEPEDDNGGFDSLFG